MRKTYNCGIAAPCERSDFYTLSWSIAQRMPEQRLYASTPQFLIPNSSLKIPCLHGFHRFRAKDFTAKEQLYILYTPRVFSKCHFSPRGPFFADFAGVWFCTTYPTYGGYLLQPPAKVVRKTPVSAVSKTTSCSSKSTRKTRYFAQKCPFFVRFVQFCTHIIGDFGYLLGAKWAFIGVF